jgi:group II intron reverse transcriptase/maturase
MRNPTDVLSSLTEKSKDKTYKFQRIYRNLYNPGFYWRAYQNIYANKGSMTPGVDGTTLSGLSERRIGRIIESLKDHSYQPLPARREYIEKKNSNKKRPLGISSADDKLVQEVVRMILESIFEQTFSDRSHGFRPERSCHTALLQIQGSFTGANWFVEGDIEACFDSFDHHVLIELLRRRIDDEPFISLMWKFLKAGYMEQWEYHKTYDGVPQGSGVSPILSNIYLSELDSFMDEYKASFDIRKTYWRKRSYEYNHAIYMVDKYRKETRALWDNLSADERKNRVKEQRALSLELRNTPTHNVFDETLRTIQYIRYADDFIVGVIGSQSDAEKVKADIKQFLTERLKLTLSDSKTKITHSGDTARFLGYDITVSREQDFKKRKDGVIQRTNAYSVKLLVPREKWVNKLLEYKAIKVTRTVDGKERFKAMHRGKLINKSDIDILSAYNQEIRGLRNFYRIANNASRIGRFVNLMYYCMLKTLANKYRTKVSKIKAKYVINKVFTVEYHTKSGKKTAEFYNGGFERERFAIKDANVSLLPQYLKYDRVNSFANRIRSATCELCGQKSAELAFHQVKKLKDLKGESKWERAMIEKRRKTLVVCPNCYNEIHS